MAREATIRTGLNINKFTGDTQILYWNRSATFQVGVDSANGPCVGTVSVTQSGTDVNLSQMNSPHLAWFHNLSADYTVDVGIREPATDTFYPLFELAPGTSWVVPLSRNLLSQFGTGTGTGDSDNVLHLRLTDPDSSGLDTVNVEVSVFDR